MRKLRKLKFGSFVVIITLALSLMVITQHGWSEADELEPVPVSVGTKVVECQTGYPIPKAKVKVFNDVLNWAYTDREGEVTIQATFWISQEEDLKQAVLKSLGVEVTKPGWATKRTQKEVRLVPVLGTVLRVKVCMGFKPPEGVIPLSPVVPGMGAHWADHKDLPLGPIFLTTKSDPTNPGGLLGIEYMFSKRMMEEVPSPEGKFKQISFRIVLKERGIERTVDHLDVAFLTQGHEDFPEPHWDVHAYFFSRKEVAKLTKRVK